MSFMRAPLGLKQPKAKSRPDYLAAVRELPCCICLHHTGGPLTGSSAHHVIHTKDAGQGNRGQRKTPDTMAIPLCWNHHQGPDGVHTRPEWWKANFGLDIDYIAATRDALAHLLEDGE